MGNCAGIPPQKGKPKKKNEKEHQKTNRTSQAFIQLKSPINSENPLHQPQQYQSQFLKKSRMNQHNQRTSKIMKKYDKPMSLWEEEKQSRILEKKSPKLQSKNKLAGSLMISDANSINLGPIPTLDKSRKLFSQKYPNNEVKEMQNEDESSQKKEETNKVDEHSNRGEDISQTMIQKKSVYDPPYYIYPLKKNERSRQKKFTQVLQMFEKGTETPNYVRQLRKQNGEDINMDNFTKFQPIPTFKAFPISQYLAQISQQRLLPNTKLSNGHRTQKKKPTYSCKLQHLGEDKVIENNQEDDESHLSHRRSGKEVKMANKQNKQIRIITR